MTDLTVLPLVLWFLHRESVRIPNFSHRFGSETAQNSHRPSVNSFTVHTRPSGLPPRFCQFLNEFWPFCQASLLQPQPQPQRTSGSGNPRCPRRLRRRPPHSVVRFRLTSPTSAVFCTRFLVLFRPCSVPVGLPTALCAPFRRSVAFPTSPSSEIN